MLPVQVECQSILAQLHLECHQAPVAVPPSCSKTTLICQVCPVYDMRTNAPFFESCGLASRVGRVVCLLRPPPVRLWSAIGACIGPIARRASLSKACRLKCGAACIDFPFRHAPLQRDQFSALYVSYFAAAIQAGQQHPYLPAIISASKQALREHGRVAASPNYYCMPEFKSAAHNGSFKGRCLKLIVASLRPHLLKCAYRTPAPPQFDLTCSQVCVNREFISSTEVSKRCVAIQVTDMKACTVW